MNRIENPKGPDYKSILGIKWKIQLSFSQVDSPQILSNPTQKIHQITLPENYLKLPQSFWGCDYVGQLIRASFAEQLDPLFASSYFQPDYNLDDSNVVASMRETAYAQQVVEIWVSDRMAKLDKKLLHQDVSSWLKVIPQIPALVYKQMPLEIVLGWAIGEAQIQRHQIKGFPQMHKDVLTRINKILGKEWAVTALEMGQFYSGLPHLPSNPAQAISLFEAQTQKAAKLLGFSIVPEITESKAGKVWQFKLPT